MPHSPHHLSPGANQVLLQWEGGVAHCSRCLRPSTSAPALLLLLLPMSPALPPSCLGLCLFLPRQTLGAAGLLEVGVLCLGPLPQTPAQTASVRLPLLLHSAEGAGSPCQAPHCAHRVPTGSFPHSPLTLGQCISVTGLSPEQPQHL